MHKAHCFFEVKHTVTKPRWACVPDDLSDAAKRYWRRYESDFRTAQTLTPATIEKFKFLCQLLAMCDRAAADIEANGVTVASQSGARKQNPALAVLLEAQREATKLLDDFGLERGKPGGGFQLMRL